MLKKYVLVENQYYLLYLVIVFQGRQMKTPLFILVTLVLTHPIWEQILLLSTTATGRQTHMEPEQDTRK